MNIDSIGISLALNEIDHAILKIKSINRYVKDITINVEDAISSVIQLRELLEDMLDE